MFLRTLTDVYDANLPIQGYILKDKDINSIWISKGLKKSSKKIQKLDIKFLKTKTLEDEFKYKTYESLFEKLRKKAKTTYYSKLIYKYKTDSKRTWQVMKKMTGKQKTKLNLLPQQIKVDKTIIKNPRDIAKEFNKFFTSAGLKLTKKSQTLKKKIQHFLTSHNEKMQFKELNFDEFEEAFKSLKQNKAAGFDELSRNIIIDAYDSLKNILFHAFKALMQQGIFPDSLKIAKVTLIFKSSDKDNVSNYRPISIVPVLSKVLEGIMDNKVYNHLKTFFMKNNLVFKEITQLSMPYFNLQEILQAPLKKGNITLEFL